MLLKGNMIQHEGYDDTEIRRDIYSFIHRFIHEYETIDLT